MLNIAKIYPIKNICGSVQDLLSMYGLDGNYLHPSPVSDMGRAAGAPVNIFANKLAIFNFLLFNFFNNSF